MTMLLVIVWGVLAILLLWVAAIRPQRSRHTRFELKRRGDEEAMHREKLLSDVQAIRRFKVAVLVIVLTALGIVLWQGWAVLYVIVLVAAAHMLASRPRVQRFATHLYQPWEPRMLAVVDAAPFIGALLGSDRKLPHDQRIESTEHLLHLVETASHVLTDEQQRLLRNGLSWHDMPVHKVMTPRDKIVAVKHRELLGPLVLDDLHRSGHIQFPVIVGDIDNIVGTINISDLLEIDSHQKSPYADKVMTPQVPRVDLDEPLPVALGLLQRSHQHIIVVVNGEGQTAGLLTLSDITGALLGK